MFSPSTRPAAGQLQYDDIIQQLPAWLRFGQRGLRGERRAKMSSSRSPKTKLASMRLTKKSSLPRQSAAREKPLVGKQPQLSRHRPERTAKAEEQRLGRESIRRRSSTPKR